MPSGLFRPPHAMHDRRPPAPPERAHCEHTLSHWSQRSPCGQPPRTAPIVARLHPLRWRAEGCGFTACGTLIAPDGNPKPGPGFYSSESAQCRHFPHRASCENQYKYKIKRMNQESVETGFVCISLCNQASGRRSGACGRGWNMLPVVFHLACPPLSSLTLQLISLASTRLLTLLSFLRCCVLPCHPPSLFPLLFEHISPIASVILPTCGKWL